MKRRWLKVSLFLCGWTLLGVISAGQWYVNSQASGIAFSGGQALASSLLAVSLAATRIIASQLFGVTATDSVTFVGVPLLLLAVALLACWIPARRVTKIDPLVALRHE